MKKTMRKILAIVLTVALLAALAISPANLGVLAEETTPIVQEPYVVATNPGDISWAIPDSTNLFKNSSIENGNTTQEEKSALGYPLSETGFYKWSQTENDTILETTNGVPITDYYKLTDEDSHTGNRSLKSVHGSTDDWASLDFDIGVNDTRSDRLHSNTDYVLTFWAKTNKATPNWDSNPAHYELIYDPIDNVTNAGTGQKNTWDWYVYASKEAITDSENAYPKFKGKYTSDDVNVWKQYTIIFNTGNNASNISFRIVGLRGDIYYDDFAIYQLNPHIANNSFSNIYAKKNLLTDNIGIENGATGWLEKLGETNANYATYSQYYEITDKEKHSGEYSLKYSAASFDYKGLGFWKYSLTPHTEYVFSFWAKGGNDSETDWKFCTPKNNYGEIKDFSGSTNSCRIDSSEWKQYIYVINTADQTSLQFWIIGNKATEPIYFDDFSLILKEDALSYIAKSTDTMETVVPNSNDNLVKYGTFDDIPEDRANWGGILWNLREAAIKPDTLDITDFYSVSNEVAYSGTNSFKFSWDGSDKGGVYTDYWISISNLEKNSEYVLSFWVYGNRTNNDNTWKIVFSDDSGSNAAHDISKKTSAQYRSVNSSDWQQYSYKIVTGNSDKQIDLSLIILGNSMQGTLYFDDLSLVKESSVTYKAPVAPVKAKMSWGTVEIAKQENILYYGVATTDGDYDWSTKNSFNWLYPNTEYKFAVKTNADTEIVEGLTLKTYVKGDADYSGVVSVADMVRCYNVVTKAAEDTDFNADTDNSGVLDGADVIAIRDILLN